MWFLQVIQNNKAITIIFKPPFMTNLERLGRKWDIKPVAERLQQLNYLAKSLANNNPLISLLTKQYILEFGGKSRTLINRIAEVEAISINKVNKGGKYLHRHESSKRNSKSLNSAAMLL